MVATRMLEFLLSFYACTNFPPAPAHSKASLNNTFGRIHLADRPKGVRIVIKAKMKRRRGGVSKGEKRNRERKRGGKEGEEEGRQRRRHSKNKHTQQTKQKYKRRERGRRTMGAFKNPCLPRTLFVTLLVSSKSFFTHAPIPPHCTARLLLGASFLFVCLFGVVDWAAAS